MDIQRPSSISNGLQRCRRRDPRGSETGTDQGNARRARADRANDPQRTHRLGPGCDKSLRIFLQRPGSPRERACHLHKLLYVCIGPHPWSRTCSACAARQWVVWEPRQDAGKVAAGSTVQRPNTQQILTGSRTRTKGLNGSSHSTDAWVQRRRLCTAAHEKGARRHC